MAAAMESLANLRKTLADLQVDPQLRDNLKYVPVEKVTEAPDDKFGLSFKIRVGNINDEVKRAQVFVCLAARPAGVTTVQIQFVERRINGTMVVVDDSFQENSTFKFVDAFELHRSNKTSFSINALARYYFLLKLIQKQNHSDLIMLKSRELFPSMQINQFQVVCRRFKELDDIRPFTRSEQRDNWEAIQSELRSREAVGMKKEDSDVQMVSHDAFTALVPQQRVQARDNRSVEHKRRTAATQPSPFIDFTEESEPIPSIEVDDTFETLIDHSTVAEYLVIEQRLQHYAARRTSYELHRNDMKMEQARLAHAMGSVQAHLQALDAEEVKDKAKQAELWDSMSKEQVEAVGVGRERERKRTQMG